MIKRKLFLFLLLCSIVFSSCDDFFNVETEDFLTNEENYKERDQIYSGMVGVAANFRDVMDDYIILSELRGDLLEPTETAPDEYWDIFRYKSDANNSVASPAPLYQLVANCNDFLRNLRQYKKNYPDAIAGATYNGMVAATLSYRAWAYLNIGKLYGEAYYHDLSVFDINQDMSQGVLLSLDDLVKQLISSMQNGVDGISAFNYLDWRLITMDPTAEADKFDQSWSRITVNPDALLTELFLWDRNYIDAAKQGILAIKGQGLYAAGTNNKMFNLTDYNDKYWQNLFREDFGNSHLNEAMTALPFNYLNRQTHKLQYYFSNNVPNIYRFRPTKVVTERNFIYDQNGYPVRVEGLFIIPGMAWSEEQIKILEEMGMENIPQYDYDFDYYRESVSIGMENGMEVVSKYSLDKDYKPRASHEHDATIYVYRAAELHLMVAEALTGIGNVEAADSLISVGLKASWDKTEKFYRAPFNAPIYAGDHLSESRGILGRLNHEGNYMRYYIPDDHNMDETELLNRQKFVMDSIIAQETARELAFEGKRWFTLVRMARNGNMPEKLANVVSKKFSRDLWEQYRVWLMEPNNWFMKWNHSPEMVSTKNEEVK